jgi:hypothetical protein
VPPGYTYGTQEVPPSPVSMEELELLKRTVMFGDDTACLWAATSSRKGPA